MKRIFIVILCCFLLFSLFLCGCHKYNFDNDYKISIYKEIKEQNEKGEVFVKDYKLWKTIICPKTEMFEIPNYTGNDTKNSEYIYDNINIEKKCKEKAFCLPKENKTIFVRQRKKKDITILYNGKDFSEYLSGKIKESYNNYFKNTFNEKFSFYMYATSFGESIYKFFGNKKITLYYDKSKTIKFYESSFYNDNYFSCLESKTLYLEVE